MIHDWFNGTFRCADCAGPCQLEPGSAEYHLSMVTRYALESLAAMNAQPNMLLRDALTNAGVDVKRFTERAYVAVRR